MHGGFSGVVGEGSVVGGLTGEIWVVDLDVAEAVVVKDLEFGLVSFGDVGEIFFVTRIDVFGIRLPLSVPHVVPFRRRHCEFAFLGLFFWYNTLQVIPLINVSASNMLDLAGADDAFGRLVTLLHEGRNVGHVGAEDLGWGVLDFLEAFHAWEESTPEHYQLQLAGWSQPSDNCTYCDACIRHLR